MRIELGKINQSWGKQGENNSVELAVDVSAWKSEYPSGAPSAAYTRADGLNYVLPVVMDGNYAVCTLSRTETACAGVVRLQISWIQGELVAKTALFEGYIELGIVDEDEELDSPEETVLEQMQQYAAATAASASAAASSASAAQAAQTEAEAAQDAAEDAQSAAETAQGKAEAAQTAAETAQTGAETARTQAQEAQNAAVTAQGKAEDAQKAAEAAQAAAEGAAEDLSAAVASAAQSASSAAQSATDASGYASAASSSATAAAGSATTAQGHASAAQTARAGAESAQSAAETAQGLAEDAQEAAETARNAAQSAQSAAESAKSSAEAAKSGAETAKTAAETAAGNAQDDADAAASSASAAAQSAQAAQEAAQTALGIIDDEAVAADSTWSSKQIIDVLCPPLEETGNPVQCYPVAGYPLGVKASWEPKQSGEGDPSPDNVRPIVGLDEVTVALSGINLLDYNATSIVSYASFGLQPEKVGDNSFRVYGTSEHSSSNASFNIVSNSQTCLRGKGYTIHILPISGCENIIRAYGLRTESEPYIALMGNITSGQSYDMRFRLMITPDNAVPQEYAPFSSTAATLSLPSTVYGGEVDLATGEGVETVHGIVLDGTEPWSEYNSGSTSLEYFQYTVSDAQRLPSAGGSSILAKSSQKISHFAIGNPHSENVDNAGWVYSTGSADYYGIRIRMSACADVDEWKSYLAAQYSAGTPVTIAYKLATPQPIQATGSQSLPALSGENVLITNADSLTVTGRADPNHTIQTLSDRIAALESETIEGGTNA